MKYFRKIVGKRVYLSPINIDDLETYTKWINDPTVANNLGAFALQFSLPNERKALEELATNGHTFAIVTKDEDRLIGNIGVEGLSHLHQRTNFGIFIGDEEYRSQGYGAEAIKLLLGYCFNTLNMHSVGLDVHADNERAIACYRKIGFRECGQRREARFVNGRFIDVIQMDILATEFIITN